jgi:hypothetical protein
MVADWCRRCQDFGFIGQGIALAYQHWQGRVALRLRGFWFTVDGMKPTKPPSLLSLIGEAIEAKTDDPHQARLEVARSVVEALQLARRVCPVCEAEAYAAAGVALLCGACRSPMQEPDGATDQIGRFIAKHGRTLRGLADR